MKGLPQDVHLQNLPRPSSNWRINPAMKSRCCLGTIPYDWLHYLYMHYTCFDWLPWAPAGDDSRRGPLPPQILPLSWRSLAVKNSLRATKAGVGAVLLINSIECPLRCVYIIRWLHKIFRPPQKSLICLSILNITAHLLVDAYRAVM